MSYASKSIAAVVALLVMGLVFSRQLFLFAAFREPQGVMDAQGGRYHLWFSLAAAALACVAGALMFYFFGRQASELSQPQSVTRQPTDAIPLEVAIANSDQPIPLEIKHSTQPNPWLPEGKSDDRTPVDGSVAESFGTPAGQRSFARESHQLKFKAWSQARRD
jgi:hypothetical protein